MRIISTKLRNSARGQECMFQIPGVCNHNPETTVFCHIRDDGKGMGNKASDLSGAFGCSACHDVIDQHRLSKEDELYFSLRAMQRTHENWVKRGLMIVPRDKPRAKPTEKVAARNSLYRQVTP